MQSRGVQIWRWKKIVHAGAYKRNLQLIKSQFKENRQFRDLVQEQVRINLGSKIAEAEQKHGLRITPDKFDIMAHYLLEEIAGLWYLQFDLGYCLDFYPGQQMQVMSRIYEGGFPVFSRQLGYDWKKQGFIEVGQPSSDIKVAISSSRSGRIS